MVVRVSSNEIRDTAGDDRAEAFADDGVNEVAGGTHALSVASVLAGWRERGDDRFDPVRFRLIEALGKRADTCTGTARRLLDQRLSVLVEDYARDLDAAGFDSALAHRTDTRRRPPKGALGGLVGYVDTQSEFAPTDPASPYATRRQTEVLEYFRELWSRLRTENQWREFPAHVPQNAGPLNTNKLVYRSLLLMRELSPGYLQQFLTYVNGLSSLGQLLAEGSAPPESEAARANSPKAAAARTAAPKKRERSKAR